MPFPPLSRLESPILLELKALGGECKPKAIYSAIASYFPSLTPEDLKSRTATNRSRWRLRVQGAATQLERNGDIQRTDRIWRLTDQGRERALKEDMPLQLYFFSRKSRPALSHDDIKNLLAKIGELLGKHAQTEYRDGPRRYDVVWKDSPLSPRISHVFEVQNKGSLEGGLAKLKHAYDSQRSRPFLVIADERDGKTVREHLSPYLAGSFHEIGDVASILTAEDVQRMYQNLSSVKDLLRDILKD